MRKLREGVVSVGSRKALTLVEVALGAAILTVVLLSIISVYIKCIELVSASKSMTFAVNEAQAKMEGIRDHNYYLIYADYNNGTFTVPGIAPGGNKGVIYVDNSDPDLLKVTISVCWRERGRIIGEDINFNGVLDSGEDKNYNGIIDSTAQLVLLITQR